MKSGYKYISALFGLIIFNLNLSAQPNQKTQIVEQKKLISDQLIKYTNDSNFNESTGYNKKDSTFIDSVTINTSTKNIAVYFDSHFSYTPFRDKIIDRINNEIMSVLADEYINYKLNLYSDGHLLQDYIPNYYRKAKADWDQNRRRSNFKRKSLPVVTNLSHPFTKKTELYDLNIALWPSHGWYYESSLDRWEWQRARFLTTVEDLYTTSFTMNYLVPMLENAGALVFLPRERHWQTHEVVVDNDSSTGNSKFKANLDYTVIDSGFALKNGPLIDENPFRLGTTLKFKSQKRGNKTIDYIPDIPEDGIYPVYISYISDSMSSTETHYTVFHAGGSTEFSVNQQIGGGTWIFLGNFDFKKGINPDIGKVEISAVTGKKSEIITADAARFGGGMGNISRNGQVSGRPRYQEGARYYLQYAGMPDTLVWHLNDTNDYADDYQCRGEWVNYLIGAPMGPKKDRNNKGLGIPVDMSLAFHTDAGMVGGDSVIGTLCIYNTKVDSNIYPNGLSKMASRDLADIIQTQIVNDIRQKYDPEWTRRGMWDKAYSEATRPNVPSLLLEFYSHQNFNDVRFGKEPAFQFDASRAVYKGIVRFLSTMYGFEYKIQPLPVTHFQAKLENNNIVLQWKPQVDPLESTTTADNYIVYTKIDDGGFDNGVLVKNPKYSLLKVEKGTLYTFRVTALNKGGESFPSEELSVAIAKKSKGTVTIINDFDRVGGPAWFNNETHAGFMDELDQGVPYQYDFHTVGSQYDFDKKSPWLDDDSPGFGASFADMETEIVPGNTFNFTTVHAKSILKAGYSVISASNEAVESNEFKLDPNTIVDFLTGEEKTCYLPGNDSTKHYEVFTPNMLDAVKNFLNNGGKIFLSGANIGTDSRLNQEENVTQDVLKYKWRTNHASRTGKFHFTDNSFADRNDQYQFNTGYNPKIYTVESPDAIEPANAESKTLIRYNENNMSAGVIYQGKYKVVALGFPFETILGENQRDSIMAKILDFLNHN